MQNEFMAEWISRLAVFIFKRKTATLVEVQRVLDYPDEKHPLLLDLDSNKKEFQNQCMMRLTTSLMKQIDGDQSHFQREVDSYMKAFHVEEKKQVGNGDKDFITQPLDKIHVFLADLYRNPGLKTNTTAFSASSSSTKELKELKKQIDELKKENQMLKEEKIDDFTKHRNEMIEKDKVITQHEAMHQNHMKIHEDDMKAIAELTAKLKLSEVKESDKDDDVVLVGVGVSGDKKQESKTEEVVFDENCPWTEKNKEDFYNNLHHKTKLKHLKKLDGWKPSWNKYAYGTAMDNHTEYFQHLCNQTQHKVLLKLFRAENQEEKSEEVETKEEEGEEEEEEAAEAAEVEVNSEDSEETTPTKKTSRSSSSSTESPSEPSRKRLRKSSELEATEQKYEKVLWDSNPFDSRNQSKWNVENRRKFFLTESEDIILYFKEVIYPGSQIDPIESHLKNRTNVKNVHDFCHPFGIHLDGGWPRKHCDMMIGKVVFFLFTFFSAMLMAIVSQQQLVRLDRTVKRV